jgi:hypothetical protein
MKKINCLIVILLSVICLLTGCRKESSPTELHFWHHSYNGKVTKIIYEARSTPTEIIENRLLWDIDNVQLDLYFGRDTKRSKKDYYNDYAVLYGGYELVCFAAYFFWPDWQNNIYSHEDFSDYKNPPDAIFLKEISSEEFLSEKYDANYGGRAGFLRSYPPVFNELHEPLRVTLSQEVFRISEEKSNGSIHEFRFEITPVFYHKTKNVYFFGAQPFGEEVDGLTFGYEYHGPSKISIGPH